MEVTAKPINKFKYNLKTVKHSNALKTFQNITSEIRTKLESQASV